MAQVKKDLFLIGGGGHCEACIDVIETAGQYRIIGISDVEVNIGKKILCYEITHTDHDLETLCKNKNIKFLLTVGQVKSVALRRKLADMVINYGGSFETIISPLSYVSKHAEVGAGTIVMHHALINGGAVVGENCIVNSKSLIEHGAHVGDFCHISTGAIVNGTSSIANECFLGSNSVVVDGVSMPEGYFLKSNERFR